ncbi:MAG: LapA family protein [Deltaproteobacteria bacterium]|nr:MAG: LapA family protein [Deltaproteobacteria bacterium]
MSYTFVLLVLIGVFGFLWKNKESLVTRINIDYKFWEKEYWATIHPKEEPDFSMEAGILILVSFTLGVLVGGVLDLFFGWFGYRRNLRKQRKTIEAQAKRLEALEQELQELKESDIEPTPMIDEGGGEPQHAPAS